MKSKMIHNKPCNTHTHTTYRKVEQGLSLVSSRQESLRKWVGALNHPLGDDCGI